MPTHFCCYCGRPIIPPLKFTREHLVPVSKGGNNSQLNLRPCCLTCNQWRQNKTLSKFKEEVIKLLSNKNIKGGYTRYDLQIMVENIDYISNYIHQSNGTLRKQKSLKLN